MPAIADERPVDEPAVVDPVRRGYDGEVDMPPGLRPIGGGGEVRRVSLSRVDLRGGPRDDPRPDAGDAVAGGRRRDQRGYRAESAPLRGRGPTEELVVGYRAARHD